MEKHTTVICVDEMCLSESQIIQYANTIVANILYYYHIYILLYIIYQSSALFF